MTMMVVATVLLHGCNGTILDMVAGGAFSMICYTNAQEWIFFFGGLAIPLSTQVVAGGPLLYDLALLISEALAGWLGLNIDSSKRKHRFC